MEIRLDLMSWSFGAGVLAFFNPCGFAMLPAYVAHYLGSSKLENHWGAHLLLKGVSLGGVVSAGFVTTFTVLGLIVTLVGGAIGEFLPWVGAAVGLGLVLLGLLMLFKNYSLTLPALERLAAKISQSYGNRRPQQKDLLFYYFYGITYALASTGCTLPIFMVVVGTAFAGGLLNGLAQFGAYALGMTLMMLTLSLITVISKGLITKALPKLLGIIRWVGAAGVMAAGAYLIYYNLFYIR